MFCAVSAAWLDTPKFSSSSPILVEYPPSAFPKRAHSSPSGLPLANRLSPPPTTSATIARIPTVALSERLGCSIPDAASLTSRRSSGRESKTKQSTADVISPSIRPIARWIGCISPMNAPNGSSVIPDRLVSSTTEKAPSCSVTTHPMMDAAIMRLRSALLPSPNHLLWIIGFQMRKYPTKHP